MTCADIFKKSRDNLIKINMLTTSDPQSHSSPGSTYPLPHSEGSNSYKEKKEKALNMKFIACISTTHHSQSFVFEAVSVDPQDIFFTFMFTYSTV